VELIVISRILRNFGYHTVASHFATLTWGNISNHIFKMYSIRTRLYCVRNAIFIPKAVGHFIEAKDH